MTNMKRQSGQIFIFVIIVVAIILFTTLLLVGGSRLYFDNANYSVNAERANNLAEAGIDKALNSLNKTGGTYNGESETFLENGSYSISITNKDASTKIIKSTGYVPSKTKAKAKRSVQLQVSKGVGISFVYGLLIGNGGITMGNGSQINGSIYSNGNIFGGNNDIITGDAYVAGGTQATADQQNDCLGANCDPNGFVFGKTVSGNNQLDVTQSFKPASTAVLNKVSLKLKKVGSPPNPTVRIMSDNAGLPNPNNVLASGTLSANLVTSQYNLVDVSLSSNPTLTANTTYWIMIAAQSLDSSNYWYWSNDLASGYNGGVSKWSPDWQAKNPVWNSVSGDLGFQTWMGGVVTSISMSSGSIVQGSVHANTINGITVNKDAYYQVLTNSIVKGSQYPGSSDPTPIAMPISQANITDWQNEAANHGVISTTDISGCPTTLGPGKITANVTLDNNCTVTVTTPVWITKNLTFGNSTILKMASSLGSSSGTVIVDGTTLFQNSDDLLGTGSTGSYLTLLSTYNSQSNGIAAINTGNSSITGILYAPYGTIVLANNASFKESVAWQINMGNNSMLTYDSGLINTFFSSGPGGSFTIMKGTYSAQ